MRGKIRRLGLARLEVAPAREVALWIKFHTLWLKAYDFLDF
jgi:hypothetical protein